MADGSNLPLAINLLGPMVLEQNVYSLEVWLPDLTSSPYPHEVGIATNLDSIKLDKGDYSVKGPTPAGAWPVPLFYLPQIQNQSSEILKLTRKNMPGSYIHFTLPRPKQMVGLFPEQCQMIYNGVPEPGFKFRATGVRLLYETTGFPYLNGPVSGLLPIDVAAEDQQVEMSINHHPVVHDTDPKHLEAKSDFKKMAAMIGVMNVDIEFPHVEVGPAHDCVNPVAMI